MFILERAKTEVISLIKQTGLLPSIRISAGFSRTVRKDFTGEILKVRRMRFFAREVLTNESHSGEVFFDFWVIISTTSPFRGSLVKAAILPSTLAPEAWFPTSE